MSLRIMLIEWAVTDYVTICLPYKNNNTRGILGPCLWFVLAGDGMRFSIAFRDWSKLISHWTCLIPPPPLQELNLCWTTQSGTNSTPNDGLWINKEHLIPMPLVLVRLKRVWLLNRMTACLRRIRGDKDSIWMDKCNLFIYFYWHSKKYSNRCSSV